MSSQDRLENVLRDIHVMISKSEVYDADKIIVSKNDLFNLIDRLNASIYEIMDEYELTQQSRDHALREHKKEGDKIIWDASRQAEDIYAASVLYTDEALNHLNRIVEEANITISQLYREFGKSIKQQQETIRENQSELKSQLQYLSDTEKYLNMIEVRNREIEREAAEKSGKKIAKKAEKTPLIKPEIKINEEYFRKAGIPLDNYLDEKKEDDNEMELLEDEGVIASTLQKVALDLKKEVIREVKKETVENETNDSVSIHETIKDVSEKQQTVLHETGTTSGIQTSEKIITHTDLPQNAGSSENSEPIQDQIQQSTVKSIDQNATQNEDMTVQMLSNQKSEIIQDSNMFVSEDTIGQQERLLQQDMQGEGVHAITDEIKVNLDAEYFKWKQESEALDQEAHTAHREKTSFFDKLMGKKKSYD